MQIDKPLPPVDDPDAAPYWAAARRHVLALQHCTDCGNWLYPPGPACPCCGGTAVDYVELGGEITATLYSYIVTHRAFVPGFAQDAPYVVALAEVDQAGGTKLLANLLDCPPEAVRIGMPLRMVWEARGDQATLPQWVPA